MKAARTFTEKQIPYSSRHDKRDSGVDGELEMVAGPGLTKTFTDLLQNKKHMWYFALLAITVTFHIAQTDELSAAGNNNLVQKFKTANGFIASKGGVNDVTGQWSVQLDDRVDQLGPEDDTEEDAMVEQGLAKRYMRFGRKFEGENNKRYMRFGRRPQPKGDVNNHFASIMKPLTSGRRHEHEMNENARLDVDGQMGEPLQMGKDAAKEVTNKRYMRFGRR